MNPPQPPYLHVILPAVAAEVEQLLRRAGYADLAEQVATLRVVDRCRCGEDFCATIYTQPEPEGAYPEPHFTLDLHPAEGILALDVVANRIACIEILGRDELRHELERLFP